MPFSTYLPEHMGSIKLSPVGPFVAGSSSELTLVYTAGTFGIDDTRMVKMSWRTTSHMSKPQFDKPQAANFTTVEASNGAKLEVWFDPLNIRPYANNLLIDSLGDLDLSIWANDVEIARANPMRIVTDAPMRRYWGDLHGQSGETIGMGSAEAYFRYARDAAFIDMVGHQGNDFQITDAFWKKLNQLTAEFDQARKFVCLPGYEWSGNTGLGGDRNIFYLREGRPIRRSSHILVGGQTSTDAVYTADELFRGLQGEDAIVIAHVGGPYAGLKECHDGRL